MSVRAYRVNKIDYEDSESFNLWHDDNLMEFLEENGFYDTLTDGCGLTEVSVSLLEEIVNSDIAKTDDDFNEIKKSLKKDIAWAKKHKEDYIRYYCF